MKAKRIISLLLATLMLVCAMPLSASAFSIKDVAAIVDATENVVKIIDKLSAKELSAADLIKTTAEQLASKKAVDAIKEVLDNGTDVFVEGKALNAIAERLGCDFAQEDDKGVLVGGYIYLDDLGYGVSPIYATLHGDNIDPIAANRFAKIKADEFIDYNELVEKYERLSKSRALRVKNADESIAALQTEDLSDLSVVLGGNNYIVTQYIFFQDNGSDFCTYAYSTYDDYIKVGSITIMPTVYNAGTKSDGNYNVVSCYFEVAPDPEYEFSHVYHYKVKIEFSSENSSQYKILQAAKILENSTTTTGYTEFSVGFDYKGTGLSAGVPVEVDSETFGSKSQKVTNGKNGSLYAIWEATPRIEPERPFKEFFVLQPEVFVWSAKNATVKMKCTITEATFYDHIRAMNTSYPTYTVEHGSDVDMAKSFSFKDHKAF